MTHYSKANDSTKVSNNKKLFQALTSAPKTAFVVFEAIFNEQGEFVDARYKEMNEENERLLGFAHNEVIGKTVLEVFPETPREWFEKLIPVLKGNCNIAHELRYERTGRYCLTNTLAINEKTFAFIAYDLTESMGAKEKLVQSENKYRSLLSKMNSAFAVFSAVRADNGEVIDAIFVDINSRIEKFSGLKLEDVIGKSVRQIFPDAGMDWFAAVMPAATENKNVEFEKWFTPLQLFLSVKAFPFGDNSFALILKDKTEEVQLKRTISDTALKYNTLFSDMDAAFTVYEPIYDTEGNIVDAFYVDVNAKKEEYLGKSASELIGQRVMDVYPETERNWFENAKVVLEDLDVVRFKLFHKQIGKHFACTAFSPKEKRVAIISYDISERVRLKNELIKSEEKYRALFYGNSSVQIVMNADDGKITDANEAAVQFYGYGREKLLSMNINQLTQRNKKGVNEILKRIAAGELKYFDSHHVLANGETKDVVLYADQVTIDGKLKLHFIIRDVTESKKIAIENQKLSMAVEQSPASIMITDLKGNIEYVNQSKCDVSGYSREELLGENPRLFKSGKMSGAEYTQMWKKLLRGEKWLGEFYNKKKNGDYYWEQAAISGTKNERGELISFIKVAKDITEQKRLNKELQKAKLKAEESDRLKTAFLANLSHEVRTPLNGIMGFTELLLDEEVERDEEQKRDYADIIKASGEQLLMIMDDIMDISKIEAGELSLNENVFSVNQLFVETKQFHSLSISKSGKDIELAIDICCQLKIKSDKDRIKQVLDNLVKNAIKFTDKGKIVIGYQCNTESILFFVEDTGIGIAEDDQLVIFDRFRQLESHLSRVFGGNGLGLSICKQIVEFMGGEIWVESEIGKGSKFCFTIPLHQIYGSDNTSIIEF